MLDGCVLRHPRFLPGGTGWLALLGTRRRGEGGEVTTTTATTECGIFPGMSWADYAAIPLPSASTLEWGRVSSAHLQAAIDGTLERKDSDAMSFGRALHLRLLEPDIYPQ